MAACLTPPHGPPEPIQSGSTILTTYAMPTPIARFLRHLIRNAAIMAILFLGFAATGLAMALAFSWGGPLAALAVFFFVFVVAHLLG